MVSLVGSREDRGGLVYLQTPGAWRLAAVSPVVSVSVSGITGGESGGSWRSGVFTDARSVAASRRQSGVSGIGAASQEEAVYLAQLSVVSLSVSGITGGESGGSWRSGVFTDARSVAASSGQPSCQSECEWYHRWGVGRIVAVWCIYRRQERGG